MAKKDLSACLKKLDELVDQGLSPRDIEDMLDGTVYKDSAGVEGRLRVRRHVDRYGIPSRSVSFDPTPSGRRHPAYVEIKRKLRDDWETDLGQSTPETWADHLALALCAKKK